VFDYLFDLEKGSWRAWMATVEAQAIPTSAEYSHIIVTTPDVVRYTHLMRTLIAAHTHALLVGPTGTGKSRYVVSLLATLPDSAWSSLVFNFSARTSANMTQVKWNTNPKIPHTLSVPVICFLRESVSTLHVKCEGKGESRESVCGNMLRLITELGSFRLAETTLHVYRFSLRRYKVTYVTMYCFENEH
jgi:hypothetical protein